MTGSLIFSFFSFSVLLLPAKKVFSFFQIFSSFSFSVFLLLNFFRLKIFFSLSFTSKNNILISKYFPLFPSPFFISSKKTFPSPNICLLYLFLEKKLFSFSKYFSPIPSHSFLRDIEYNLPICPGMLQNGTVISFIFHISMNLSGSTAGRTSVDGKTLKNALVENKRWRSSWTIKGEKRPPRGRWWTWMHHYILWVRFYFSFEFATLSFSYILTLCKFETLLDIVQCKFGLMGAVERDKPCSDRCHVPVWGRGVRARNRGDHCFARHSTPILTRPKCVRSKEMRRAKLPPPLSSCFDHSQPMMLWLFSPNKTLFSPSL